MDIKLIFDTLTWIAVISTLGGYYLISKKVIDPFSWSFQISVLVARICFLFVDLWRETYPFALMDFFFLLICFETMYKLSKQNKTL